MKITVTRSFRRVRQIADYVPIEAYCEAASELEFSETDGDAVKTERMAIASSYLDEFCRAEVEKTLMSYYPLCIVCGGRGAQVNLNKEGVCGTCVTSRNQQARSFKKSNDETSLRRDARNLDRPNNPE